MYQDFELILSIGEVESFIPYNISVHQDDILAPIRFNFFQAAVKSLAAI